MLAAGFECLAEDVDEVMGLFSEVLNSPALPEEKVALYKSQVPFGHHHLTCKSHILQVDVPAVSIGGRRPN